MKIYCEKCKRERQYDIRETHRRIQIEDSIMGIEVKRAFCRDCDTMISTDIIHPNKLEELNTFNDLRRKNSRANGL